MTEEEIEQVRTLEESLWRRESRFDLEYMERILDEGFVEFGRSGRIYQRNDTLAVPPQDIDAALPLADFQVRPFSDEIVQVTYHSQVNQDGELQKARRSSIWQRSGDSWTLLFHQGTVYDNDA